MPSNYHPTFFLVVNVDTFFLSHRLPIALMMKEKGYEVYIITKDTGSKKEIENYGLHFINVNFDRAGKNPFKELKTINVLRQIYRKYQPNIIHHVTIKPFLYGSIASKVLKQTKIVNAISGLGFSFIGNRKGIVQMAVKPLMKIAFNSHVNFIFQNPDDLNFYKQLGYLQSDNYRLIKGAGVDTDDYTFTPPIEKDKLHIVLTARMLYDKGIKELIDAALLLKEKYHGKILFQLVGGIDTHNPTGIPENTLKAMQVKGYIEWLEHRTDIKELLIQSDIVCLPSYREGLPKSLIEAMAIGRPIVTTDVPGCRECVVNELNGFLVPAQNVQDLAIAIEKLINSKELRMQMGKASRDKMLEELSLTKVLAETFDFYNSIKL